jgi:hypothetical protein
MNPEQKEERARFRQEARARITLIATERGLPKSENRKSVPRFSLRGTTHGHAAKSLAKK